MPNKDNKEQCYEVTLGYKTSDYQADIDFCLTSGQLERFNDSFKIGSELQATDPTSGHFTEVYNAKITKIEATEINRQNFDIKKHPSDKYSVKQIIQQVGAAEGSPDKYYSVTVGLKFTEDVAGSISFWMMEDQLDAFKKVYRKGSSLYCEDYYIEDESAVKITSIETKTTDCDAEDLEKKSKENIGEQWEYTITKIFEDSKEELEKSKKNDADDGDKVQKKVKA